MGIKACHRAECENIMCDRYSPNFGYLCYECYSELMDNNIRTREQIRKFMDSPKKSPDAILDIDEEFAFVEYL